MPQEFTDANGQRHILDGRKWRPATPEEVEILDQGFLSATGSATGEGLKSLAGLAQVLASFAGDRSAGLRSEFGSGRDILEQRAEVRQGGLERMSQAQQELDVRGDLTPGASTAGAILTELIPEVIPGGIIAGGVARGLRSGTSRAAKNAAEEAAQATARRIAGQGQDLPADAVEGISRAQANQIGAIAEAGGSVGADRVKRASVFEMMKRTPGLKQVLTKLEETINTPRPISNDQARMLHVDDIEPSAVERSGFRLLPGQAEGNGVIAETMKSQPFLADAFDDVLTDNARMLETKVLRAMGLPEGGFGRASLGEFDTLMRGRFQQVANSIDGGVTIPDELRQILDDRTMMTADDARLFGLTDEGAVQMDGGDIMELRSVLNDSLAAANSDRALGVRSRHIKQQLDKVDDLISESMPGGKGGEAFEFWKDTQQRWRVGLAANGRGVIQPDGSVSIKQLANSLDRTFEQDFRKNLFQVDADGIKRNADMPDDIAELLDFTRIARAFESNLGDSGTATRTAINKIFSGDLKGLARQVTASRFIKEILLDQANIPQAAKGIAGRPTLPEIATRGALPDAP